ncbi:MULTISPECIES: ATP-binding protein [unclassified Pseudodesulfovibrio]|uniref:ATP-binding protein n=1 Tax=unclassified Pseudodesulfovibrio TaxID=2661612 RepID=UPI000FEBE40D|nr:MULTISPECIES: ATP-binding protein [unclassified Pseudodesulfovibrio]MCJ2165584.1 ATP-binding protein [Pseudodesulfovibrio sp. S3-i]RWU02993.1 PAS domain-containing protein [Pseudodesulfovibrio sp. S3]
MNDFTHENMGICYWNGSLGPFNVGVVGTGATLKVLIDLIYNEAFREFLPEMRLTAISNADQGDAPNLYETTCPVYVSFEAMLAAHPEINLVVEITGDKSIRSRLRQSLPDSIALMDHREIVFLCGLHDMAVVKGNYMVQMDHQRTLIQSIIDEIREDIFLLDKKGIIQDLNRTVWQRAGVPRKELLGKPCWVAARLRDGSDFCNQLDPQCPFHKTLQSGQKEETLITRVNGSGLLQYYRLYAYPIYDMRGNMSHIMVMHRDITERTQREKYQQQRDKFAIIGEMSTYLAHEIRNPLYAVGGFANALLRSTSLGEQEREKVQIIVDETKRLDRLLTSMLSFARPSSVPEGTVDVVAVCRDVAELMLAGYGKHGYQIEVRTTPPLPSVQGDTDSLKQCLVNTVKNSIEAMADGGLILIEIGMGDNEVVIRIIDTGSGMDEHQMDRAFNPFYSTKDGGSGLGLPMIKKIIEECGGSVSLASKPGKGTTVTIRLQPALDSEASVQVEPAEQQ